MTRLTIDRRPTGPDADRIFLTFYDTEIEELGDRVVVTTSRAGKLRLADWALENISDPDSALIEDGPDDGFPLVVVRVHHDVFAKITIDLMGVLR